MTLPWSAEQREWLQALGHPVMVLAADGEVAVNPDPEPVTLPEATVAPARSQDRMSAPSPGRTGGPVPALHRALLKATGLPVDQAEQFLGAMGVDAAALRADPAAKRALWTRLRQLRRGQSR